MRSLPSWLLQLLPMQLLLVSEDTFQWLLLLLEFARIRKAIFSHPSPTLASVPLMILTSHLRLTALTTQFKAIQLMLLELIA
jgi:hypothetical protein